MAKGLGLFKAFRCLMILVIAMIFLTACDYSKKPEWNGVFVNSKYPDCGTFASGEVGHTDENGGFNLYENRNRADVNLIDVEYDPEEYFLPKFSRRELLLEDRTGDEIAKDYIDKLLKMSDENEDDVLKGIPGTRAVWMYHFLAAPYASSFVARKLWNEDENNRRKAIIKLLMNVSDQTDWWLTFALIGEVQDDKLVEESRYGVDRDRRATSINLNCRLIRGMFFDEKSWLDVLKHIDSLDVGEVGSRIELSNSFDYPLKVTAFYRENSVHETTQRVIKPGRFINVSYRHYGRLEYFPNFDADMAMLKIESNKGCNRKVKREDLGKYISYYTREKKGEGYISIENGFEVDLAKVCAES